MQYYHQFFQYIFLSPSDNILGVSIILFSICYVLIYQISMQDYFLQLYIIFSSL